MYLFIATIAIFFCKFGGINCQFAFDCRSGWWCDVALATLAAKSGFLHVLRIIYLTHHGAIEWTRYVIYPSIVCPGINNWKFSYA